MSGNLMNVGEGGGGKEEKVWALVSGPLRNKTYLKRNKISSVDIVIVQFGAESIVLLRNNKHSFGFVELISIKM